MDMMDFMLGRASAGGGEENPISGKVFLVPDAYSEIFPVCVDYDSGDEIYVADSGQKLWVTWPTLQAYGELKITDLISGTTCYTARVQLGQSSGFTVDGAPKISGTPAIQSGTVLLISVTPEE